MLSEQASFQHDKSGIWDSGLLEKHENVEKDDISGKKKKDCVWLNDAGISGLALFQFLWARPEIISV